MRATSFVLYERKAMEKTVQIEQIEHKIFTRVGGAQKNFKWFCPPCGMEGNPVHETAEKAREAARQHMFTDPLAIALAKERRRQRVRQTDVAELVGVHESTIGEWERGDASPELKYLRLWCKALGVRILAGKDPNKLQDFIEDLLS